MPVLRSYNVARPSATRVGWLSPPAWTSPGSARASSPLQYWTPHVITARTRACCDGQAARRKLVERCSFSRQSALEGRWPKPTGNRLGLYRPQSERHRPIDDDSIVQPRDTLELSHAAAQPLPARLDFDAVARMDGMSVAHPIDGHEENQFFAVLGLRQDENGADLRDSLRENRRRQRRCRSRLARQVSLVERYVLDSDNPLVRFELNDPIDEQKRIAMRDDALDRAVIERQRQRFH